MMGFRFQDPWWLFLLVPLVIAGIAAVRRQRRHAVLYSDTSLLAALPTTVALRIKRALPWVRLLGMALLVVALARPQYGREEFRIRTEGIAIQMCIDRSGSMEAIDFPLGDKRANRLEAVKHVFRDFVAGKGRLPGRPDDQIGLVAFGGFPDGKCPLTLDHGALLAVLDSIEIPERKFNAQGYEVNKEERATAIGDAVALAVDQIKDAEAKSKVVILLSDGEQTAGLVDPLEAAEVAKTCGVKIYSIGVGSTGMAPFPKQDEFGRIVLRPEPVRLDEETLREMAEITGGRYFSARNTRALEDVYAEIDKLEKTESEGRLYTEYSEWYQVPMFIGLGLILLQIVLVSTRFRSLP